MPTLEHDDAKLFYRDEGKGQPVMLLHGFPLSSESFQAQLDALPRKMRLIVPDHRGFGRSTLDGGPTEMSRLAKDALAILDALDLESVVVGGVSMGGYVAMALARLAPARLKALVLIDTQPGPDDDAGKARREATARDVEAKGMEVLVESMMPTLVAIDATPATRAKVGRLIRANTTQGASAALRGMALRPDSRDVLSQLQRPTLVVVGERDTLTPPEKSREMAALISGSRLVEIPSAGHLSNLENPEAFNRALEEFVLSLPKESR